MLDLDYYKLTMLQFIWKHYASLPVKWRMHSRRQSLSDIITDPTLTFMSAANVLYGNGLSYEQTQWLHDQQVFDPVFIRDLDSLLRAGLVWPEISSDSVTVEGQWFTTTLWETVLLSTVSEQYSKYHVERPNAFGLMSDLYEIDGVDAKWADFGTRRRWSRDTHKQLVKMASGTSGFIGTSNVQLAIDLGLKPIGTYAHELEMVLRNWHKDEVSTTRTVLTKWAQMYPHKQRIALTDTYGTKHFFENHGRQLMEENWRGVRLDSGDPFEIGFYVDDWVKRQYIQKVDVIFSDGLDADTIVKLQQQFGDSNLNPLFGWGTGFTNPNSDLSLVMKAVESNGSTYKRTDDPRKTI